MAELRGVGGMWTLDGDAIRIVPGQDRKVHPFRRVVGELTIPLAAVASLAFEPGRKGGRLRLRLRGGSDALWQVCGGKLPDDADPYQIEVPEDRSGVAEYFADAVRAELAGPTGAGRPDGESDRFLTATPAVPLFATGNDGTAAFDGDELRLEWNWLADLKKRAAGPRVYQLADIEAVQWHPALGMDWGHLRIRTARRAGGEDKHPRLDPDCLTLWGTKKESGTSALLAAAVVARLPHPYSTAAKGLSRGAESNALAGGVARPALEAAPGSGPASATSAASAADSPAARLRELAELHRDGILTDEEFSEAKAAVLKKL